MNGSVVEEAPPNRCIRNTEVDVRFSRDTPGLNVDRFVRTVTSRIQFIALEHAPRGAAAQEFACLAALREIAADLPPHTRRRICVAVRGLLDGRWHEFSFDFGTLRHPADGRTRSDAHPAA